MCNIIEKEVGEFEADVEGVKFRLLGEVKALRAMSYWYLVNTYGEPYRDSEQAKTAMGVPVNKETSIKDKLYTRTPLQEVYDLIENDLKDALENMEKGERKNSIFRPNKDVVRLFLSRIYLEEKRYDEVIKVCDEALKETNRTLISLNEMLGYSSDSKPMLNKNNSSIIFSWLNKDGHPTSSSNTSKGTYCPSENLIALFASNDVRNYRDVLVDYWNSCQIVKYNASYSGCWNTNYRIEEFYFNRAEANIKQGEWELGMKDVNEVYSRRIEGGNGRQIQI